MSRERFANARGRRRGFGPGGFDGGQFPPFGPPFGGPRFHGPGGPRRRSKGDVRAALLAMLAEGEPISGYAFMKAVAERTEGAWSPSPGSVYPTIQQLLDEGLIEARGEGRATEYTLSDEGSAYVEAHRDSLEAALAFPAPSDSARALFESVGKLMSVLGQYRHAATDEQRAAAAAKIDETRKALYLILAE